MKTYQIILKSGLSSMMEAENNEHLRAKILSGHYGVLPIHGEKRIVYTPENIKEIIEIIDDPEAEPKKS